MLDSQVYYFEIGRDRWRGSFSFRITDRGDFRPAPLGLKNRLLMYGLALIHRPRWKDAHRRSGPHRALVSPEQPAIPCVSSNLSDCRGFTHGASPIHSSRSINPSRFSCPMSAPWSGCCGDLRGGLTRNVGCRPLRVEVRYDPGLEARSSSLSPVERLLTARFPAVDFCHLMS